MPQHPAYPVVESRTLSVGEWATPLLLMLALIVAESVNHSLFHTLAEFFAVIVAMLVAVVGWQAYPFSRNKFLMYLACGYFWIGMLDLAHAVTYRGVGILPVESGNVSIQLWVGTRYLEALLLLSAPFALSRTPPRATFWFIGVIAVCLASAIGLGVFPTAFVPGSGLTPFKVISEYIIIGILTLAAVHLWRRREDMDGKLFTVTMLSIIFTAASEFCLTIYMNVGDLPTIVGHLFKFLSYWLIYVGMIATTLREPFRTLARGASTFDAVPDPTVVVDENGIIRHSNRAARGFLAVNEEGCIGQHCHELLHDQRTVRAHCPICQAIGEGRALEDQEVELTERRQWHQITLSPISAGASTPGMVHVSRDVTQRVLSARALSDSESRFRGLVESTNDWVWEVNEHIVYTYSSPQVRNILGYEPEEIVGKTPLHLMPPEEAERIRAICLQAIADRAPFKALENINYHKDGRTVVLETNGAPFFDETGAFRGFRGIDRDISARKQIEQELERYRNTLEQQVEERTRALEVANRELAAFSYSVSHDLRAPLRAVDGFSRMMQKNYGDKLDASGRALLERIHNATVRMGHLIDDLLQLARFTRAPLKIDVVDLSAMASSIAAELTSADPERPVHMRIAECLEARGDTGLLRVVLQNLLGNAWKFTVGRTPAVIEFGTGTLTNEPFFFVRDNGAGFDMQYVNKLFGAFQRLHSADEFPGSGIGLATVQRVIHRHGGRVWAEGETGKGATIYFTLPPRLGEDCGDSRPASVA